LKIKSPALLSKAAFVLCSLVLIYSGTFFYPRWQHGGSEAQISWDAGGYYWYLPSVFIYHDLRGQQFHQEILDEYRPTPPDDFQYAFQMEENGNYIVRYTMGTALLEAPFFIIAHAIAKPLGYPNDGFSFPYQLMIYVGGIFFVLLGLWYLRKLLLYYFSDKVVAITLLLLVLGTNYLNYCGIDVGMSHCWLFTIYVFLVLNTHYYYQTFKRKYAIRIGVLVGIATLIRPPEFISVLIPLLWKMENISLRSITDRLQFLKKYRQHFIIAIMLGGLVISLQFIYWKYASGQWLVYTYQDQKFVWFSPHLEKYAFNYESGWLVYTPLMMLAVIGIIPFLKYGKNRIAIITFIIVNYYVVASWDQWQYGGRAMLQSYPVILFLLASLIDYLIKRKFLLWAAAPFLLIFTYFNLWWTYQAHSNGGLTGSFPTTSQYFLATALRYNLPKAIQKLRDNKDHYTGEITNPRLIYTNDFNDENDEGKIIVDNENPESKAYSVLRPEEPCEWIRAGADIHIGQKEWNVWFMTEFIIRFKKGEQTVQENYIRLQRLLNDNETKHIYLDARVENTDYDRMEIQFKNDNNGSTRCEIDNLTVTGFND